MRRRLAVSAVVVTALVGEWLGHGISYYRVAGAAGLQAALGGGIHGYMLPLAAVILTLAGVGAAGFTRAWLALGRRLDRSARLLRSLRRGDAMALGGDRPDGAGVAATGPAPSWAARLVALAAPLAVLQSALYLVQENLERVLRGLPAAGLRPLLDGGGAAVWIQGAVALLLAGLLLLAFALLRSRQRAVQRLERLARALWSRARRATAAPSARRRPHVVAIQLLLGSALWQRPPPASSAA